jgi:polyhydroxyalkanoate synthesis regulator phasin
MLDTFKKSIYTAIGFAVMTREKAEELGKKMVQEAEMSEAEGKQFVDELIKKSDEMRAFVEKVVNERVETALKVMNIPVRSEINDLENRIRKLESRLPSQQELR